MSDVKLWDEEPNETNDDCMVEDEICGSETNNIMLYELIAEQFEGLADLFYKLADKEWYLEKD